MIEEKELKKIIKEEIKHELESTKKIYIETCREDIQLPNYAHKGDAGMDLRSAVDIEIKPGETKVIPTGLKCIIPAGYELQIRPRSGISLNTPLRLANSPGTIDSGYRDEIGIIINNISTTSVEKNYEINEKGNKEGTYIIKKGDRIAQMVLCKYETIEFVHDKRKTKIEIEDRNGGFGHSGVK